MKSPMRAAPTPSTYRPIAPNVPTGTHRHIHGPAQQRRVALAAPFALLLSVATTLVCGMFGLSFVGSDIPAWIDDVNAHCLRARRQSDATLLNLAVGSPPRMIKLLFQLDALVTDPSKSTTIFADELLRSETLRCDENRTCTDSALLVDSSDGRQRTFAVSFEYGNAWTGEFAAAQGVGAEAVMRLSPSTEYWLSRTHLCWRPNVEAESYAPGAEWAGFDAHTVGFRNGVLVADVADIAAGEDAVASAPAVQCANSTIDLFPREAIDERSWLALSSDYLFEAFSDQLDRRRAVVEKGTACADESPEKALYDLDCTLDTQATCRTTPSIPYRRVSRTDLRLHVDANGTVVVGTRRRDALSRLVGGSSVADAAFFATVRLVVLLVVAFVVYNRSGRASSSAYSTIATGLDIASGGEHRNPYSWLNAIGDAGVGILAIASRLVVLVHQSRVFVDDGHADTIVLESMGIVASTIHFCLRNVVLKTDLHTEAPLSKLGGSMSLADASAAALLSVVTTPSLSASTHDFDAVARLFCAVLTSLFVWGRAFYATSACALLASTTATSPHHDPAYSVTLGVACVLWLVQCGSVAFSLARFYCIPQAFSLLRFCPLPPQTTATATLLASVALATPTLNSVSARLAGRWKPAGTASGASGAAGALAKRATT